MILSPVKLLCKPIGVTEPIESFDTNSTEYKQFFANVYNNEETKLSIIEKYTCIAETLTALMRENNPTNQYNSNEKIDSHLTEYLAEIRSRVNYLSILDATSQKARTSELNATLGELEQITFLLACDKELSADRKKVSLINLFADMANKACFPGMHAKVAVVKHSLTIQNLRSQLADLRTEIIKEFIKKTYKGYEGNEVHAFNELVSWAAIDYDIPHAKSMASHGDVYAKTLSQNSKEVKNFKKYFQKSYTLQTAISSLVANCAEYLTEISTIGGVG